MPKRDGVLYKIVLWGILTVHIWLLTYLVRFPVPATGGYVHAGDGAIFLAAAIMGPYAAIAAGIGAALSDLLGGYWNYIITTLIIKAAMGGFAGLLMRKGRPLRNVLVFAAAECMMIIGYYLSEGVTLGWSAATSALGSNALQGLAGIALGVLLTAHGGRERPPDK